MSLFRLLGVAPVMRSIFNIPLIAASLMMAGCGSDNGDRLDDNQVAAASEGSANRADTRCTSAASHEAVKRELFRRAAEIRGSNAENYARIAGFALLVVDDAAPSVMATAREEAECKGRATLRLPPNLSVAGGRTSLTGTVGFTVSAGSPPTVTLTDDEAITIPLATLTQKRAPAPAPAPESVDPIAPQPAPVSPENAAAAPNLPSFDCERARAQSEYAVCANPALARLDRAMSQQYRNAVANADAAQIRLLTETRDRFLAFRNRCGSDDCIAQTYRGRIREIDDIMAGRWQPPR